MSNKTFSIPEFDYIRMGGHYSGNKRGTAQDDFNFSIVPEDKVKITVKIWYGLYCLEKSELVSEKEFELSQEGYNLACEWLEEQVSLWHKEHKLLSPDLGYWSK